VGLHRAHLERPFCDDVDEESTYRDVPAETARLAALSEGAAIASKKLWA